MDPRDIFVEVSYQRTITENGIALIRRIFAGFDWAKFKPPVCIRHESGVLVCIDGQHTATAAASHPEIALIPVMVVEASSAAARAEAFVGHNRDRVALTRMTIYRAELAAGNESAEVMRRACATAGAIVCDNSINLRAKHPVGTTIAVGTIQSIAKRMGEEHLARVLKVLVAAERGPIKAGEIAAVDLILARVGNDPEIDARLAGAIAMKSAEQWQALADAEIADKTNVKPKFMLASLWCRELSLRLPDGKKDRGEPASPIERKAPPPPPPAKPDRRAAIAEAAARLERPAPPIRKAVAPPPPAPAPKPPPPRPASPAASPGEVVTFNGVTLDLGTGELKHRRHHVRVHRPDGVKLVNALTRTMGALLDPDRLARIAFGDLDSNSRIRLKALIEDIAPVLHAAELEIRVTPLAGITMVAR